MKLIVGLGNPGDQYKDTRHNIGYMVVDRLSHELGRNNVQFSLDKTHMALTARVSDVLLVKPTTFMNNSGIAVKALADYYSIHPTDIWVIHDDIDLPLGKIRIREKGGSAGHNGVTSILKTLSSDQFVRFRMGIGRGMTAKGAGEHKNLHHRSVIDFVLSRFTQSETGSFRHLVKYGTEAVRIALLDGLDKAMNRFN
jgi:PTH1 family peptidyl-tRNA hydrolase